MNTLIYNQQSISYDGTQLDAHWIYRRFNLMGNAIVAFTGPAHVDLNHMVDLEDVKHKAPIASPSMLHFIGEWFEESFDKAILFQHLFMCEVYETLLEKGVKDLSRRGNDIYCNTRKVSVSIATRSTVSLLMHARVNIHTEGTPIPTAGLAEWDLEPIAFAASVLEKFSVDYQTMARARTKVLPR